MSQPQFHSNIDNEDEDELDDEGMVDQIKMAKFKERLRRAEILMENAAIEDVVNGVESAKQLVNVKSIFESYFNLNELRDR